MTLTSNNNESSLLSLQTCTSQEMASWLLQHRFGNNGMEVTTFLLEAVSSLPNAQAISDQLMNDESTEASPTSVIDNIGAELLKQQALEISFTTPRSKFQVTFGERGMHCIDKHKHSFKVSAVEHVILFPKPQDCQKATATDQVLLVLTEPVNYKNKALQQVCFALPTALPELKCDDEEDEDWSGLDHSDQWTRVLCQAFSQESKNVIRVLNPAAPTSSSTFWRYQFSSHDDESTSTTTGGMPYIKCYHRLQDGALYPLQEGLLFFKPTLFLHKSQLHSIACGRQGNDNSRYVDMTLQTTNEETLEFTNIHRSELTVLREYIHQVLIPAMQKDVDDGEATAEALVEEEEEELQGQDVDEVGEGRRIKRKAGLEARAMTRQMKLESDDEEDKDEDFLGVSDDDGESSVGDEDDETESEDEVDHPPVKKSRKS